MDRQLVYDVGMNNGDDTAYYLYRGFRVVAIEADPRLVELAARRFQPAIAEGRLTILNIGIGPQESWATFWVCEGKSEWSSFDYDRASRNGHTARPIQVPCHRLNTVLAEHGVPHYLKIDIESFEQYCLADLDANHLPKYVSVEVNGLDELLLLKTLGYDSFKLVLQGRHAPLLDESRTLKAWLNRRLQTIPPLGWLASKAGDWSKKLKRWAGRATRTWLSGPPTVATWDFPFGSSGPFGDDTPGDWLPFDEAAFRVLALVRMQPQGFWCDVHATCGTAAVQPAIRSKPITANLREAA